MNIEPDEYMAGKVDAQARMPQRLGTTMYRMGFLDGLAERSKSKVSSIDVTTIDGSKISVTAGTDETTWKVECDGDAHTGAAIDFETAFAAAEGTLRSLGRSVARRSQIEDSIRRSRPGIAESEVARIATATEQFILTHKGAFAK